MKLQDFSIASATGGLWGGVACAIAQRVGVADRRGAPKLAERLPEGKVACAIAAERLPEAQLPDLLVSTDAVIPLWRSLNGEH